MALFDWNRNGKDDMFDRFMDYQVYKQTFGKDEDLEDEDDYLFEEDDEDLFAEDQDDDCLDNVSYHSRRGMDSNEYEIYDTDDLYGMREISGKRTDEILRTLIRRRNQMHTALETCSIESGFRKDVMDNSQMISDFWLFELNWALEESRFTREQRIQVLELLKKAFRIENPTNALEHYEYMQENNEYYKYFQYCFGSQGTYHSLFWIILAMMSGNNGEYLELTTGVTEDMVKFHMQLNTYLTKRFPGYGFDYDIRTKLIDRMNKTSKKLKETDDVANAARHLINPIYANSIL